MRSFRKFFPFGTLEVLNWARRRMRCVRFWSAGPAPNLTAMRRPNLTLHRMAAPPRSLVIRESQRAAIGELTVRRLNYELCPSAIAAETNAAFDFIPIGWHLSVPETLSPSRTFSAHISRRPLVA